MDRDATRALKQVVEAGATYAVAYNGRVMEHQSIEVFDAMKSIYEQVRSGMSLDDERRRIRALFATLPRVLLPKHMKALLRTAGQVAEAGGPSDCALETVGFVFGKGGTTLRHQRKRTQLPTNVGDVTFGSFSNMINATAYVVGLLGWDAAECDQFHTLAQELFSQSGRSAEAALTLLFSGPREE